MAMNAWSQRLLLFLFLLGCNDVAPPTHETDNPATKPAPSVVNATQTHNRVVEYDTPMDAAETELPAAVILGNRDPIQQAQNAAKKTVAQSPQGTTGTANAHHLPKFVGFVDSSTSASTDAPDLRPHLVLSTESATVGAGYIEPNEMRQYAINGLGTGDSINIGASGNVIAVAMAPNAQGPNLTLHPVRTVYDSGDTAHVLAKVMTQQGTSLEGIEVTSTTETATVSCVTDAAGICILTFPNVSHHLAVFASTNTSTASANVHVNPVVLPSGNSIGIHAPTTTRATGETFQIPVFLSSEGLVPGAYDMRLHFDPSHLEVTGVTGGDCQDMGTPVSNIGNANSEGTLRFNAIGFAGSSDCLTSLEPAHVATVSFLVLDGSVGTTSLDCEVKDYLADNFSPLGNTCTGGGPVPVGDVSPSHFVFATKQNQLDDRYLLDGVIQETELHSRLVLSDGTITLPSPVLEISGSDHITIENSQATVGMTPGVSVITATAGGLEQSLHLSTRKVTSVDLVVADESLERIADSGQAQPTHLQILAQLFDGTELFVADVTEQLEDRVALAEGFDLTGGILSVSGAAPGEYSITLPGIAGAPTISTFVNILTNPVSIEGLAVLPVCTATAELDTALTTLTVHISSQHTANSPCTLQTHAWFSDGSVSVVPDTLGVIHTTSENAAVVGNLVTTQEAITTTVATTWHNKTVSTEILPAD
jgi:hypothetical protein